MAGLKVIQSLPQKNNFVYSSLKYRMHYSKQVRHKRPIILNKTKLRNNIVMLLKPLKQNKAVDAMKIIYSISDICLLDSSC